MTSPTPSSHVRGAVDLSSLRRPASAAPRTGPGPAASGPPAGSPTTAPPPSAAAPGAGVVRDVTDETFTQIVELSRRVPVVIDLWAEWCGPCKQLSPVLERLAVEYAGRFLLAKIDVDANPQISAAFQVQSIPSVFALLGGQPVPMFQGAYPEAQVRKIIEQLLKVAVENGVAGTLGDADRVEAPAPPEEPALPPLHQAAYDALEQDDLDGAASAFAQAVRENPRDEEAKAGLAQVELLKRLAGLEAAQVLTAAATAPPTDLAAHLAAADVEVATGRVEEAFGRLVAVVRAAAGPDRDKARMRLLDLFQVVGTSSPEVGKARRALASALY